MAKALLKLAPVRVGLERPWAFREGYRKVVRRHNLRVVVLILPFFALLTGGLIFIFMQPVFVHQSSSFRGWIAVGVFLAGLVTLLGFLVNRARRDCARFHLQCPACGKDLYGSKRMRAWLEGDTQSIGRCPHCQQILQCARPGVVLSEPTEGAPILAQTWKALNRILRRQQVVLLGGILIWVAFIASSRWLHFVGLQPGTKRLLPFGPLLMIVGLFALIIWTLRASVAAAKREGVVCARCAEPLIGRRIVRENDPTRLICLACGTLMRVEA